MAAAWDGLKPATDDRLRRAHRHLFRSLAAAHANLLLFLIKISLRGQKSDKSILAQALAIPCILKTGSCLLKTMNLKYVS